MTRVESMLNVGNATKFRVVIYCPASCSSREGLPPQSRPLPASAGALCKSLLFKLTLSRHIRLMLARQRLKTRGFLVLYHAIPESVNDTLRSMANNEQAFWVHDTWDGVLHDEHRLRALASNDESQVLSEYFERHYRSFFTMATVTEWRFLKSTGGAEEQPVRREFAPTGVDVQNVGSVPGCIFVATQDRTFVYGYGWNNHVALRSEQHIIELNKGDVLLSRGDFAYAAAGNAETQIGLLGYIDTPLYQRPQFPQPIIVVSVDDTRDVDDMFCFVWNCPFRGTDTVTLRRHLNRYHQFFFNRPRAHTS